MSSLMPTSQNPLTGRAYSQRYHTILEVRGLVLHDLCLPARALTRASRLAFAPQARKKLPVWEQRNEFFEMLSKKKM